MVRREIRPSIHDSGLSTQIRQGPFVPSLSLWYTDGQEEVSVKIDSDKNLIVRQVVPDVRSLANAIFPSALFNSLAQALL